MNTKLLKLLKEVKFGKKQKYSNLLVLPLIYTNGNELVYISIDEAFNKKSIVVTEINEGGSVPELFLKNNSDERILLLDGEELIGAKQNRILNTTIIIEKKIKLKIPVSCVEAGRWGYNSKNFSSSNRVSPSSLKMNKAASVTESLRMSRGVSFRSDQRNVWNEVDRISASAKVKSASRAMSDVYEKRNSDIEDYVKEFKCIEGQNGIVVFINGRIVGIEYVSNMNVFNKLFPKLIRGYAMDALIQVSEFKAIKTNKIAKDFIKSIEQSTEEVYKSVGLGDDHRLSSDDFVGSALTVADEVVHFTALKKVNSDNQDRDYATRPYIRRKLS